LSRVANATRKPNPIKEWRKHRQKNEFAPKTKDLSHSQGKSLNKTNAPHTTKSQGIPQRRDFPINKITARKIRTGTLGLDLSCLDEVKEFQTIVGPSDPVDTKGTRGVEKHKI